MALSWPWSPVWRSRSWWRRSWACLQACSSSPEPSGASRRPDSRADVNEATSFSPLSFLSIFHSPKFNARPIDTSDVTRRCHPEETVILWRNSSRYNLVNRLSAQSVSDETVGGLGGAPADRSEPVRSACVREPRPRRRDRGAGSARLHDEERPSAIVPRGDQRGPPGGNASRGEGPTCGGRQ